MDAGNRARLLTGTIPAGGGNISQQLLESTQGREGADALPERSSMWNVSIVTEVTGEEATAKVYVYDACGQIRQKKNFRIERQGIPKYRAELAVLLEALKELKPGCRLVLKPMQMPVGSAIRLGWAEGWRKRGWKTAAGKPHREAELWEQIMERLDGHQIREVKTQEGQGQEEKR